MKKIFTTILLIFICHNVFSQIKVKEDSFHQIDGFVMLDKNDHYDDNNRPMALIKISTENIKAEERRKFIFKGNMATYFDVHFEPGEIWLYLSTEATFIEIIHDDYGKTELVLPYDLKGFCGYEMVVQYVPLTPQPEPEQQKKYPFIVKADQSNATIYIDDEPLDVGEAYKTVDEGTTHTYKIECNLYHTETGTVIVNERTVINKTLRPNFGYINVSTSPEQGAKVFVDGDYLGVSPIKTDKLKSGSHTVRVMKEMYKMKEQSFTVTDGQTTNVTLNMAANFVNVTINTDSQSDIYVDEEYKGKGRWIGRLSDGSHIFEARKTNHKPSRKSMDLVLGENKSITLEAPKPINGSCEISSSPMGATIYIDGKNYGETPNYINEIIIGTHELKLEKQGCTTITKTINVKEGETLTINEKLQTGKEIVIKTDKTGDKVYVDGSYVGLSPITSSLSFGTHEIKAERDGKYVNKTINISQTSHVTHGRASSDKEEYMLTFSSNETITVNGVSFTMIAVDGGTFQMGATSEQGSDAYNDEKPVHSVTLSDYYIGETEVTQELWQAVMGSNPSYSKGSNKPVEKVSWDDCQKFVKKLNRLTGKNFRLPTEAEWEYAARGGDKSKGYKYSGSNTIGNVAWYDDNSSSTTHNVKTKSPNELGIYDMSGNVYEWCQDWYGNYSSGSQTNPTGASSGSNRVLRGGGWRGTAGYCRVSNRSDNDPGSRYYNYGFRLALSQ